LDFVVKNHRVAVCKTAQKGIISCTTAIPSDDFWYRIYSLQIANNCCFELKQPYLWDHDDFEFKRKNIWQTIPNNSDQLHNEELWNWLGSHLSPIILSTILALPRGEYLLIKSPLPISKTSWVPIGNGDQDAAPNTYKLVSYNRFFSDYDHIPISYYSYIHGSKTALPSHLNQPLLGISMARYSMESKSFGSFFFPIGPPLEEHSEPQDRLLIIPVTGELVIDFMPQWGTEDISWRDAVHTYIWKLLIGDEPKPYSAKKRSRSS